MVYEKIKSWQLLKVFQSIGLKEMQVCLMGQKWGKTANQTPSSESLKK